MKALAKRTLEQHLACLDMTADDKRIYIEALLSVLTNMQ